ncbi:hypothetical protein CCR75_000058 [Bremia lactucae]|uniref:Uncharacterized protein n=1 Tax=Bremia lactucae TaxID=4779 RepID=A0A976FHR0_BRELC|nr:hypothetical protein CCR75_000058 [Bremia lactucae]
MLSYLQLTQGKLARHIICVLRYKAEFQFITGEDAAKRHWHASQLRRHFASLKALTAYRSAFTEMDNQDDWTIPDTFFEHYHPDECSKSTPVLRAAI